jgi:hypothetical protein
MARRRSPSRRQQPLRPLPLSQRVETGTDGYEYVVAAIAGSRAVKVYRCPGCDQEIRAGIAHVVVWRADSGGSAWLDGGEAKLRPAHESGGSAWLDGGEAKLGPPKDSGEGDDRRHWHTPCWANRHNRSPTRKWS